MLIQGYQNSYDVLVTIGSPQLKANQSINLVFEVITELEKYNNFLFATSFWESFIWYCDIKP